jgi:serine/threonine-protein kinase RsbW
MENHVSGMHEERNMMRMPDEQTIEVTLPNKIGYERIAMACSASFAKILGFVPERIEDLKTAVSEACLNAVEHGNKGRPEARVVVTLDFKDDAINVCVQDEGEGLEEWPQVPNIYEKISKLESPRGLGIFLIEQLVDQVDFHKKSDKGHIVSMVIKLAG